MHLADLLSFRAVPAAGVAVGITRRCPLHCPHCSTSSTAGSEELPSAVLEQFVDSFTSLDHPQVLAMSGGEAMMRPDLVRHLALKARQVGTRSSVLSGLFFATRTSIPPKIRNAIEAVDHFSVSMDQHHEAEVPRRDVFRTLDTVLDLQPHVSIHLMGHTLNDTYLGSVIPAIRQRYGERIPMLVNTLSAYGRAREWFGEIAEVDQRDTTAEDTPSPCTMAAWPVVTFDGTVAACGNDNLIGRVPPHLKLGHIRNDGWPAIARACRERAALRALRLLGPLNLSQRLGNSARRVIPIGSPLQDHSAFCRACTSLSLNPSAQNELSAYFDKPGTQTLELAVLAHQQALGSAEFARRHAHPHFADLVTLGY